MSSLISQNSSNISNIQVQQQSQRPVSFSPVPINTINTSNKPQIHFSPVKQPISNIVNFTAHSHPIIQIPASDRRNASPIAMRPLSPLPSVSAPQIKIMFDNKIMFNNKQAQSPKQTKVSISYNSNNNNSINNVALGQQQHFFIQPSPSQLNIEQQNQVNQNLPRSVSQPSLRPVSSFARI